MKFLQTQQQFSLNRNYIQVKMLMRWKSQKQKRKKKFQIRKHTFIYTNIQIYSTPKWDTWIAQFCTRSTPTRVKTLFIDSRLCETVLRWFIIFLFYFSFFFYLYYYKTFLRRYSNATSTNEEEKYFYEKTKNRKIHSFLFATNKTKIKSSEKITSTSQRRFRYFLFAIFHSTILRSLYFQNPTRFTVFPFCDEIFWKISKKHLREK